MSKTHLNASHSYRARFAAPLAAILFALAPHAEPAKADYTKVNSAQRVTISDVSVNCDFRFRLLASKSANNSYKVTYVSQNSSTGYVLDAPITTAQGNELIGGGSSLFLSPAKPSGTPPPGAPSYLRVIVPINSQKAATASLVLNGQSFNLRGDLIDLEKQCASTSGITAEGGGADGCAMLAIKDLSGTCRCAYSALSNDNPCRNLGSGRQYILGTGKSVGPVDNYFAPFYFFDANKCACEFCDPDVSVLSGDRNSCSCKFSSVAEILAVNPPNSPYSGGALRQIKDSCTRLMGTTSIRSQVFFNKSTCACEICPKGTANSTGSGCI